jgi:hypothetical protein
MLIPTERVKNIQFFFSAKDVAYSWNYRWVPQYLAWGWDPPPPLCFSLSSFPGLFIRVSLLARRGSLCPDFRKPLVQGK